MYKKLYPSGSCPRKFYGTAKLHKIGSKELVENLRIRTIISNINISTYNLPRYLENVLESLRESVEL